MLKLGQKVVRSVRDRGPAFALVTVISVLAITLVLLLGLFSMASVEAKSANNFRHTLDAQRLAETANNMVIAQIRRATFGKERDLTSWASQPGALHSWDREGNYLKGFKLYSDSDMFVSNELEMLQDLPDFDWQDQPGRYADLNRAFVTDKDGVPGLRFPVVDPRAAMATTGRNPQAAVEGFSYTSAGIGGVVDPVSVRSPDELRLPMPVEWLYILRDGTVGHVENSGGKYTFVGPVTPDEDNPIVGRVAYWADIEDGKLNVNTASEPTPWDTPRAGNKEDYDYGRYQPAHNEWQRYPGHPLSTGLGAVIFPDKDATVAEKEELYSILPRVEEGGTVSGSRKPGDYLRLNPERLYASMEEFLLDPEREAHSLLQPSQMDKYKFFLTANSRSPELNAFGEPRIAIWPIGADNYPRTPYDKLIAFCSTVGGKEYYFQRSNPNSKTADWDDIPRNQELFAYLQDLTDSKIPGVGKDLASNWVTGRITDRDQILMQIFDYIRSANLKEKTSGGRQFASGGQVTPIELKDPTRVDGDLKGFGRFFSISEFGLHFICNTDGDDVDGDGNKPDGLPLPDPTDTLSENERLVECAFLLEPFCPSQGFHTIGTGFSVRVSGLNSFSLNGESLEFQSSIHYVPSSLSRGFHGRSWGGPTGVRTWIKKNYPLVGRKKVKINASGDTPTMQFSGGQVTVEVFRGNSTSATDLVQTINLNFPAGTFPVPELVKTGTTVYRGAYATTKDHWWSFATRYGPAPRGEDYTTTCPQAPGEEYADPTRRYPLNRGHQNGFKSGSVFRLEDVVRTMVPYHGDNRLVAGLSDVPSSIFRPHVYYNDPRRRVDHLFNDTQGTHHLYGFSNEPTLNPYLNDQEQLETNNAFDPKNDLDDRYAQLNPVEYHYSRLPDVPVGTGRLNKWGDFDNGVAQIHDGAYINKPDEGNDATKGSYAYFAWNYSELDFINFSPNRLMPSPGMFGSLPTGVKRGQPWQTLLFRPQEGHPGQDDTGAPEHHLLDLFWMPIIEPYAMSEPFATAGKVNMNHAIAPFSYITRTTALRGVFSSERILEIPNEISKSYKLWDHETSDHPWLPNAANGNTDPEVRSQWDALSRGSIKTRHKIDADETLQQFTDRFAEGKLFRSASEICEIHLVTEGNDLESYKDGSHWSQHVLSGDNTRERPYTNLYPRLTTRSNAYRVHVRTQVIQKSRSSDPGVFDPEKDNIVGEYEGSSVVERYIDPNDSSIADYATETDSEPLTKYYKFRVLNQRRFNP